MRPLDPPRFLQKQHATFEDFVLQMEEYLGDLKRAYEAGETAPETDEVADKFRMYAAFALGNWRLRDQQREFARIEFPGRGPGR